MHNMCGHAAVSHMEEMIESSRGCGPHDESFRRSRWCRFFQGFGSANERCPRQVPSMDGLNANCRLLIDWHHSHWRRRGASSRTRSRLERRALLLKSPHLLLLAGKSLPKVVVLSPFCRRAFTARAAQSLPSENRWCQSHARSSNDP